MSKSKHERAMCTERQLNQYSSGPWRETAKYMPLNDMASLESTLKLGHLLFQPLLNIAKEVSPLLKAVVQGNPDLLAMMVKENPALLFQKGDVTDPAGQRFYNISPYQLMLFLCDDDMKHKIMLLKSPMTEEMEQIRQVQYSEIDRGGADLIKMNKDPRFLPFEDIIRFTETYIINDQPTSITFPLLENINGIIYYKNSSTGREYLYYANRNMRTIESIEPLIPSMKDFNALDRLCASLSDMEDNSSRRSSNDEHALIERTLQRKLSRKGIQYDRDGIRYCDNRIEFRVINAYRKCFRLYQEQRWDTADAHWCRGVGQAQREAVWLLQRICEKGRRFYPLPDFKASPFKRVCTFMNYLTHTTDNDSVLERGSLHRGLGYDFALLKGWRLIGSGGRFTSERPERRWRTVFDDMMAICQLVGDAKANVVDITPSEDSPLARLFFTMD